MAFEDVRENFKNRLDHLGESISNSRAFVLMNERYQNFSSSQQIMTKAFAILLVVFLGVYMPMESFMSSFSNVADFEEKRILIKNIIRSERDLSALPDIPRPLTADSIKSSIDSQLKEMNFLPEQIKNVSITQPVSNLVPSNKIQYGIDVTINKINVKQLTNLGSKLQLIHPAVKVKDLLVTLNREDARYLDADIKMVALNIPEYKVPEPPPPEVKKKGKKSTPKADEE